MSNNTHLESGVNEKSCDPVNYSTKAIWKKAVEISDEPAAVKAVLKRIGRHLNHEGRRSSISITQLKRDLRVCENTIKRALRAARGMWLDVEFNKGIKRSTGRENLYHAMVPAQWAAAALEALRKGDANCGKGGHKGGQPIVARGAGSDSAMAPVLSKSRKTVSQRIEGVDSSTPAVGAMVINFADAARRLRTTSSPEVVL